MKRRDLLQAGVAAPFLSGVDPASPIVAVPARQNRSDRGQTRRHLAGMNVVLFITDQQRAIQHFPRGWAKQNLPGLRRLKRHGLTFNRAFGNSCMCSPARATLLTGYFPAQHGVKYTLEEDMPSDQYPQVELPLDLPNIATVMQAAGYHVVYKGKWHLSKPLGSDWAPVDVNQYGFERWNPPDAGANQDIDQFGGGDANHDFHYVNDAGNVDAGDEGVIAYLTSAAAQQQPFFLIVSLVNPHDVLSYPRQYVDGGYSDADLVGTIGLPRTVDEDLSTKPSAQAAFRALTAIGLGALNTDQKKLDYLNFYGNLMKQSDAYLEQMLDTLVAAELFENTLVIQTTDHGEMGMTHGGQRQKNFNFYEESLRIPLIYSNPRLYRQPRRSRALVSHVDFLPTLATLFEAPDAAQADWQGVDYSRIILDPGANGVQDYVVFTYDDFQSGQASGPYVPPPNHIVSIREGRYKLAKYFDPDGVAPDEWEMYDLDKDRLETKNLANPDYPRTREQERELQRLREKLADVEATRLQPLS